MKTKIFSIASFAVITLLSLNASAKIKRVGFFANKIIGQDYEKLQYAHDSSSAGDTILLFPGAWSATFSKKIVLIGTGYFLTGNGANTGLQTITGDYSINIALGSGSDNSIFMGLSNLNFSADPDNWGISISNIFINRCFAEVHYGYNQILSNWRISQSYIYETYSGNLSGIKFVNLLVENSYIDRLYLNTGNDESTGVFKNNVFGTAPIDFDNNSFNLVNNIFLGTDIQEFSNCTFFNNIATGNIIPSGNGNKPNVTIANVCLGYPTQGTYSNDARFGLKGGSPALGAGQNGEDCGMFGGPNPYRLSGIPAIPSFYKVSSSSTTTSGNPYTITFSVKSNN